MSSSNCWFLTCIQVSQEADQVVWHSHLFQNFPQLIVIHTVKGFGTVNKAEIDVFLELSCFLHDPVEVGNLISGHSAFSFLFFFNFILFFNFTILYWFCHISKWIHHRYACVPHPEPSSLLPPHTIPLGHPSAPATSIQYRASNLDWRFISYMILYIFQCHSPKSSHPFPFLKPAWIPGSSRFTYCWSLTWRILSITLLACEMSAIVQ